MKRLKNHPTLAVLLVTAVSGFFNFPDFLHGGVPLLFCLLLSLLCLAAWGWYAFTFGGEKGPRRFVLVWNGLTILTALVTLAVDWLKPFLLEHMGLYALLLILVILLLTPANGLKLVCRTIPGMLAAETACALALMLLCLWKGRKRSFDG